MLTKKQKIAQCFSPAAFVHDSEENHQKLERLIREEGIGSLTFFHSRHSAAANFESRAEVLDYSGTLEKLVSLINRFQGASKIPLLICIDAEYGLAMRIEKTPQYPFAITLGALQQDAEKWVEEVGYRMGMDLKRSGIHLNFAPCADVNTNPNNPVIGYRSFGDNPKKVSRLAIANYKGMKKAGIGACFKHFPGHGDTEVDSHLGLPVLHKSLGELESEELLPFQDGIDQGIELIMVGHLAVPALSGGREVPASISKEIITDFLKGKMGFKGLVVSDALNMKAVANYFPEPGDLEWRAFQAGNDLLCFSDHVKEGIEKIAEKASEEEVEVVFQKVMDLKKQLGVLEFNPVSYPEFDWSAHSQLQKDLAKNYVSILSGKLKIEELRQLSRDGKMAIQEYFKDEKSRFSELLKFDFVSIDQAKLVLVTLFVPSHKPLNQFGMQESVLEEIKSLARRKSCILIHFGNPLALKHLGELSNFESVVCAYQNFDETQEVVAGLFV